MARKQKLKVYRTPIGFHDAYVAAPSQAAALEAWGSDANLFARGIAETVSDEMLTREPLDNPGKVIKRSRGTIEEQIAALPADRATSTTARADRDGAAAKSESADAPSRGKSPPARAAAKPARKPRPSRDDLDAAESRLGALQARQADEDRALRQRERAIAAERHDLDRTHAHERKAAEQSVEDRRQSLVETLRRWREDR